jgi:hypothetical protein
VCIRGCVGVFCAAVDRYPCLFLESVFDRRARRLCIVCMYFLGLDLFFVCLATEESAGVSINSVISQSHVILWLAVAGENVRGLCTFDTDKLLGGAVENLFGFSDFGVFRCIFFSKIIFSADVFHVVSLIPVAEKY